MADFGSAQSANCLFPFVGAGCALSAAEGHTPRSLNYEILADLDGLEKLLG